jgi:hypothetical protein
LTPSGRQRVQVPAVGLRTIRVKSRWRVSCVPPDAQFGAHGTSSTPSSTKTSVSGERGGPPSRPARVMYELT